MQYETVFILTPVLSDAQMKEAVEKFAKVLTDNGASIVNTEEWGLRKLAYPIQKKSTPRDRRRQAAAWSTQGSSPAWCN